MVMQVGTCNPKNQYLFGGVPLRCVDSETYLEKRIFHSLAELKISLN